MDFLADQSSVIGGKGGLFSGGNAKPSLGVGARKFKVGGSWKGVSSFEDVVDTVVWVDSDCIGCEISGYRCLGADSDNKFGQSCIWSTSGL